MASLVVVGILGLAMGVAYTLTLRQLTEQLVVKSGSTINLTLWLAFARMLPISLLIILGVVWGIDLAIAGLAGFWLGRTAILVISFSRRVG